MGRNERDISMKKCGILFLAIVTGIVISFFVPAAENIFLGKGVVYAQADWKAEFEDICSKTQDAMSFTVVELRSLIERADKLKPLIQKLDETERKVYLKRLQMCRDLFVFALGEKEKK